MAVLNKSRLAQQWQRGKVWFQGTTLYNQATQVREWLSRNPLIVLAGIAFFFVVYILFWHIPVGQLENLRAQHVVELYRVKATIRGTFAQSLGVVLLIVGLYFAWRRVVAVEEGQITERFTRAIEQLGHEKLEVRLGGIYALERIAKDSEKDHWPIMEVLTAYVRENAPRQGGEEEASRPIQPPSTDIQAILTVIGRRERTYEKGGKGSLDLRNTQLRDADLRDADLRGTILTVANLIRADLRDADLVEAILYRADLLRADLLKTDLRGTDLSGVKNLTPKQIELAITDENPTLPDYLTEQDAVPAKQ